MIKFGDEKIIKGQFYKAKKPVKILQVNRNNIILSNVVPVIKGIGVLLGIEMVMI